MHRLLVLPHAGSAAHGYVSLRQALEPAVPVLCYELPGRGKRGRETKVHNMDAAVDDILRVSAGMRQGAWSVFGHSMGALLAHALARRLLELGQPLPRGIYASSTVAPSARQQRPISHLPSDDFWREIRAYGGVHAEILAVPDFMVYFEGILRDDFRLLEGTPPLPSPVPVPITVLYGTEEMTLTQAESWTAETTRPIAMHGFPGHHFYLTTQVAAIADVIRSGLNPRRV